MVTLVSLSACTLSINNSIGWSANCKEPLTTYNGLPPETLFDQTVPPSNELEDNMSKGTQLKLCYKW